jgi:hypothetical protein
MFSLTYDLDENGTQSKIELKLKTHTLVELRM